MAFELTHERALLLLFPNVFEFWFIARRGARGRSDRRLVDAPVSSRSIVALTALKEFQEWALHGAKLFDSIGALEFVDLVWRRLTGG